MQEVSMLLTCKHINYAQIESAVFVPKKGEARTCSICKMKVTISKVSAPYYMGETAPNPTLRDHQRN